LKYNPRLKALGSLRHEMHDGIDNYCSACARDVVQCTCEVVGVPVQPSVTRLEWVERFTSQIARCTGLDEDTLSGAVEAELDFWPDDDSGDWRDMKPEVAADENLSYWAE